MSPGEREPRTGTRGLAGAKLRQDAVRIDDALEQQLDASAAVLGTVQPRRQHARVVEDEKVARAQQRGQIGEIPIGDRTHIAVEMQQPAAAASLAGIAGDQLVGKVVRKLAAQHRARMLAEPQRTNLAPRRVLPEHYAGAGSRV